MTARRALLSLASMIILVYGVVEGSTQRVTSTKNEFGGITVEEVYSTEDTESDDIVKIISYYDDSNRCVKKDRSFTKKYANENGFNRSIVYLDTNEKPAKREFFYTEKSVNENGFNRSIVYLDTNEKPVKREFFYIEKSANENGFNRIIIYLDINEKTIKTELYMNDSLLKTDYE